MLSSTIGHADVLIWFLEVFLFVTWFWLLMSIFGDLFRDHETSGGVKALWVVLLLFLPLMGVLAYLILRGGGMAARSARAARETQERFETYVRSVAGGAPSPAEQIQQAKSLLDAGAIDRAEFDRLKAKALQ